MRTQKFAFWSYDQFPYVLGAPGVLRDDGWFVPRGYGGATFKPLMTCSLKEGAELKKFFNELQNNRRISIGAIEKGFKTALRDRAPWVLASWS